MFRTAIGSTMLLSLFGCTSYPPIKTAPHVDLERFMGDWYVIANLPTFIEKGAHNAVESYRLNDDGTIATTFTFRDGSFDGEVKTYEPTGYVVDKESNAVWGMQFIWPIKADYRIVYVDDDYNQTIIGRERRDYAWIMARCPDVSGERYAALVAELGQQGYDTSLLRRVPHRWPNAGHPANARLTRAAPNR